MQWRSARVWAAISPLLVATIVAGCDSENIIRGPRVASVQVISGNSQTGPIGGLLPSPLVVRVADQRDDPISGTEVQFVASSGGGSVTPSVDTTDADGYAQTTARLGPAIGVQTVEASLPGETPVSFTLNATPAPASKIAISAGNTQTGSVGAELLGELEVVVTDLFDNPKASIPVSFAVASGGGTLSAAVVLTDAAGKARVKWTLGAATGIQSVTASAGAIPPVTFTATAQPAATASRSVSRTGTVSGATDRTRLAGPFASSSSGRV